MEDGLSFKETLLKIGCYDFKMKWIQSNQWTIEDNITFTFTPTLWISFSNLNLVAKTCSNINTLIFLHYIPYKIHFLICPFISNVRVWSYTRISTKYPSKNNMLLKELFNFKHYNLLIYWSNQAYFLKSILKST